MSYAFNQETGSVEYDRAKSTVIDTIKLFPDNYWFRLAKNALVGADCGYCNCKSECDLFDADLCLVAAIRLEQIEEILANTTNRRDDDAETEAQQTEAEAEDVYVQGSGDDSEAFLGERIAGCTGGPR